MSISPETANRIAGTPLTGCQNAPQQKEWNDLGNPIDGPLSKEIPNQPLATIVNPVTEKFHDNVTATALDSTTPPSDVEGND